MINESIYLSINLSPFLSIYLSISQYIYLNIYFKIGRSTKRLVVFRIFFLLTCIFPACCFRQIAYMAQVNVNEVFNETWTHSCLQFEWFSVGYGFIYRSSSLFIRVCFIFVCFTPHLYFIYFCHCVCVCVCIGVVLDLTMSYFSSVCMSVCLGDFCVYVW